MSEEPFFRAVTPDARTAVEVRVSEVSTDTGEEDSVTLFSCSVTIDNKTVIESLETTDQKKMMSWMKKNMTEAMRRST